MVLLHHLVTILDMEDYVREVFWLLSSSLYFSCSHGVGTTLVPKINITTVYTYWNPINNVFFYILGVF